MPTVTKQTESALVRKCLDLLSYCPGLAWRQNNGGVYDPTRKRFRAFASLKGVPDILWVMPGGKLVGIECKVGRNKQSPDQIAFQSALERAGGIYLLVRSLDDLQSFLRDWGMEP